MTSRIPFAPGLEQATDIRRALDRALASRYFRQSERMSRFLKHVVENALAGESGNLKETSIGVAVFDRPANYDPKVDPVVRNEARRLRAKLEAYYAGEGVNEEIRIFIPKGGYSPQFAWQEPALDRQSVPPPPAEPARSPIIRPLAIIGVVFCVAAAFGLYVLGSGRASAPARRLSPLTTYPGRELHPAIAPNGKQVAFSGDQSGNYDIYIHNFAGESVRLTRHPADEIHPAWSPDGRRIAFARVAGDEFEVLTIGVDGSGERTVTQIRNLDFGRPQADVTQMFGSAGPAWSPDGKHLAITSGADSESGRPLHLVAVDTGEDRVLTHPPRGQHDLDPAFSPDGRLVAFCRWYTNSTSDIFVAPVAGGEERRVTRENADFRGLAWMPDSRSLIASSNRSGPYGLWRIPVSSGILSPIPVTATSAREPSVSPDGSRIVYSDYVYQSEIWRTRTNLEGGRPQHEAVVASTRQNHSAQLSPDGRNLAFVSDSSGSWEIWIATADGDGPRQLTHFNGPLAGTVHWSPDGKSLAFDARPEGHSTLFTLPASGGSMARIHKGSDEEKMPAWSRDGRWLYFNSNRGGSQQLWKAPVDGGQPIRLSTRHAMDSIESADGSMVYFFSRGPGIWQVPSAGGSESLVPGLEKFLPKRLWTADAKGIWLIDASKNPRLVWLYRLPSRSLEVAANLPADPVFDTPGLSVSPDGRWVYYARSKTSQSDLMMLQDLE